MRPFPSIFTVIMVGLALCVSGVFGSAAGIMWRGSDVAVVPPAENVVRLEIDGSGICSGVLINGGRIITAGHCTENAKMITVVDVAGNKYASEILWASEGKDGYDISLLYVPELAGQAGASLSCKSQYIGQDIIVAGMPNGENWLYSWGHIAGVGEMTYEKDIWKDLTALDITIAPGNSGGPVFDTDGNVIGIAVAVMVVPGRGPFGFSFMVPGETVCKLLGEMEA